MDPMKEWPVAETRQKAMTLLTEFRRFAFKGNVVDLAIGVIIGTAFSAVVKSLVDDVVMPLIGLVLPGEKGYEGWMLQVGSKTVPYGKFLGAAVNFLLTALVLYVFSVKFLRWIVRARKEEAALPLTKEQELLIEIRDLLRHRLAAPESAASPDNIPP